MKFYTKKGKLPGDPPAAPNYTIIGIKMTWQHMVNGLRTIGKIFSLFKTK